MELKKKDFLAMLEDAASKNHKVRLILNSNGGSFSKVPKHQQKLILDYLGVEMKVSTTYKLKNSNNTNT
jgi:hypothetical protein